MLKRALPCIWLVVTACDAQAPEPNADAAPPPPVEPETPVKADADDSKTADEAPVAAEEPRGPAPASMEDRAELVRARVLKFPPSEGLPEAMLEEATLTNLVKVDACDSGDCTSSTKMTGEELTAWLKGFEEIPGWDVAALSGCKDDCCTFNNLARDAVRDGGNVPHELLELRAVCFEDEGTIRRMKWIEY